MADNVAITAGSGTSIAADDISSVFYQRVKLIHGADGTNAGDVSTANGLPISGALVWLSTDVTRPADTTAYAVDDAISDSTSSPTSGGFTWTSAARASGGSGIITDVTVATSADPATKLQGEVWIFDQATTNINDNSAFAVSDSEIKTCVGVVPFTFDDSGNNGFYHARNLNIGFVCNGSANLRFLLRAKNAYTPTSSEVFTVTAKILQVS